MKDLAVLGFLVAVVCACAGGAWGEDTWVDRSPHKSGFAQANGIRLHYLDWGGNGGTMLFLTGMGLTPHIYDDLAPHFARRHRVLGLTRRGLRPSDVPVSGYDNATLVEDIRGLLDSLHVQRAVLVGHSMAGDEMTAFASRYPERVTALVYLDAAYDHSGVVKLAEEDPVQSSPSKAELGSFEGSKKWFIRTFKMWSDAVEADARATNLQADGSMKMDNMPESVNKALFQEMATFHPDYRKVKAPILAFYAVSEKHPFLTADATPELRQKGEAYWSGRWRPYQRAEIRRLREAAPISRIVEMRTLHLCFVREQDQAMVLKEMDAFLAGKQGGRERGTVE